MLGRANIWGRVIHLCRRLPALLVFPTPGCAPLLDNITAVRTLRGLPDPKNAMQCNAIQYNTLSPLLIVPGVRVNKAPGTRLNWGRVRVNRGPSLGCTGYTRHRQKHVFVLL